MAPLSALTDSTDSADQAAISSGFMRRVLAALIDGIAVVILGLVCFAVAAYAFERGIRIRAMEWWMAFAWLFLTALFFSVFEGSARQATPGKLALGIKVVGRNGNGIGYVRAFARTIAKALSLAAFPFGFLMATFTVRRQALHDKVTGALLVRRDATPAMVVRAGQNQRISFRWWTGVFVASALSALLPAYLIVTPPDAGFIYDVMALAGIPLPDDPPVLGGGAKPGK